jgi:hypothetical protein
MVVIILLIHVCNLVPFMRLYLCYLHLLPKRRHCFEEALGDGIPVCVWKTRAQVVTCA